MSSTRPTIAVRTCHNWTYPLSLTRIVVRYAPGAGGEYVHGPNIFNLPFTAPKNVNQKSLVVHEALHAGHDAIYAAPINAIREEAAAYLAQMTYAQSQLSSKPSFGSNGQVFEVAWGLAGKVLNDDQPTSTEIEKLKHAVQMNPTYQHIRPDAKYRYDGVR